LALNVNGAIKQSSGFFANSVQKITELTNYNINSNLVIVTCNTGVTSQYATLLIPEANTSNTVGTHISIYRAGNAVCRIQTAGGSSIKHCTGSTVTPSMFVEFSSSSKRADVIILDDGVYVWTY
jgi:hypothetical protein